MPARPAAKFLLAAADATPSTHDLHPPSDPASNAWGFSTRIPSLRDLLSRGAAAPAALDAALADSSAFRAAAAPAAMLEAYGGDGGRALTGLAATALGSPVDAAAVSRLRHLLRSSLTTAQAAESVAVGDAAAAAGDARRAATAYKHALTLDPRCVAALLGSSRLAARSGRLHDALDAAGAALAAGGGQDARDQRDRVVKRLKELGLPMDRGKVLDGAIGAGGRRRSRSRSPVRSGAGKRR